MIGIVLPVGISLNDFGLLKHFLLQVDQRRQIVIVIVVVVVVVVVVIVVCRRFEDLENEKK